MTDGETSGSGEAALAAAARAAAGRAVALVLDGQGLADLGVIRSLGRVGLEVWLAGPDPRAIERESRYVRHFQRLPSYVTEPDRYVPALRDWIAPQDRTFVMFCTGDRVMDAVSSRRGAFPANLIHHMATAPLVSACLSKADFASLAATLGLPVPQTRTCSDEAMLADALREFGEVFVKPDNRHRLWTDDPLALEDSASIKGFLVGSMDDVPQVVRRSLANGYRWMAQEFVAGDASYLYSVHAYRDRSGTWTESFVGQKLRTAPPRDGVGVLARSAWDEEVASAAVEVMIRMDYRGYALLQFKRDARTGKLSLLEINPRYSTWCELAERADVNLPAVAFLDALGALDGPPHLKQRDGVYWWDAAGDWGNFRRRGAAWKDRLAGFWPPPRPRALARMAADDRRPGIVRLPLVKRFLRRKGEDR